MLTFGQAIDICKSGEPIKRKDWIDAKVYYVKGSTFEVNRKPLSDIYEDGTPVQYMGHFDIEYKTLQLMVWTPTQEDMQAEDWEIVQL